MPASPATPTSPACFLTSEPRPTTVDPVQPAIGGLSRKLKLHASMTVSFRGGDDTRTATRPRPSQRYSMYERTPRTGATTVELVELPPPSPPETDMADLRDSGIQEQAQAHDNVVPLAMEDADPVEPVDSPEKVAQTLKELGISPWAALLAVGAGAAHVPGVSSDSVSAAEAGVVSSVELDHTIRVLSGHQSRRQSRASSIGLRKRRPGHVTESSLADGASSAFPQNTQDDEKIKRAFILKLARFFHQYGAPSHRFEHHLEQVSRALNVKAEFNLLPSLILVSFEHENGESTTQLIKVTGGLNMAKLAQVNALCLTLTQGLIDCQGAADFLEGIRSAKDFDDLYIQVCYPVCGFGVALLLFQLTWLESAISGMLGLVLGVISLLAEKHSGFGYLFEFFGGLVASFLARALQGVLKDYCFDYVKVTLSALAVFVPGLALTIAIIELSTKNIVSGTVRLIGALFNSMLYGFGMTVGSALVLWNTQAPTNPTTCSPTSPAWAFVFLLPLAMAVNVIFQSNRHQWPIMTLASAMGYAAYQFLNSIPSLSAQPIVVTAISGLVIGLVGNVYARFTNDVAVAPIFSAIMLQVPGALSVKSTLGLFVGTAGVMSPQNIDGVNFTFLMLSIGMSLAIGLFVATLLVFPIKGPKPKYLAI
ncbi:hypothetical protein BC830DRAFT_1162897 [Chytriomyces sp. MP71]|nr:hypothetical protein BC830DRAFT_1162897 [Chytriomyces sp. MP71]